MSARVWLCVLRLLSLNTYGILHNATFKYLMQEKGWQGLMGYVVCDILINAKHSLWSLNLANAVFFDKNGTLSEFSTTPTAYLDPALHLCLRWLTAAVSPISISVQQKLHADKSVSVSITLCALTVNSGPSLWNCRTKVMVSEDISLMTVNAIPAIESLLNLTTQSVIMFAYFLKNTLYGHQGP